ncbi:MAG: hypothetical protein V1877_02080 [Candidatus Tagabacteria bacterium]
MTIFNKTFWKFAALFAVIIFLAGGAIWLDRYYQWRKSPQYQAEKYLKEMEQKYREDTYGGFTPEETLQLFIDALKKGDTDLASKYFVVDKQEEWKNKLEKSREAGNINNFIILLEKINSKENGREIFKGAYQFTYSLNNDTPWIIDLVINSLTNKWKIESL